jgi:hypothetical protein
VRLDSFGHEGPLSPGILDRLQLLPEIRRLSKLLGDPAKDDVFVAQVRHEAEQLGFGEGATRLSPRRKT